MGTLGRRLTTFPAVLVALPLLVVTAPLGLMVAAMVDVAGRLFRFPTVRLYLFAIVYLAHEWAGLAASVPLVAWSWIRRDPATRTEPYRRVQAWWVTSLFRWAGRLLGVRFDLQDPQSMPTEPFILLSRHASMIDAILPAHVVTSHLQRFVHYVLKDELRWVPNLDVYGHRLGNYFVARAGDSDAQAEAIARFAASALAGSVLVIFPEGTYATERTRPRVLASLERRGEDEVAGFARELEHLLPPKPAGTLALLYEQPSLDVVVLGHVGLEGVAELGGLRRQLPLHHPVVIRWWHHQRDEIPDDERARIDWLNQRWRTLDGWVDSVISTRPASDANGTNRSRSDEQPTGD